MREKPAKLEEGDGAINVVQRVNKMTERRGSGGAESAKGSKVGKNVQVKGLEPGGGPRES